jgi:hypothetical protein
VRVDSLALQMRPRAPHEAADLGVRLCQANAGEVFRCYLLVAIPMALLSISLLEVSATMAGMLMWCAKPWLDRTVLFVLARAAFGQRTRIADLWREQRQVWWSQFIITWTWRRLSPWRSFTQPVYQLEGHSFWQLRRRIPQLRRRRGGAALMMTGAFSAAESAITIGLLSLVFWFAPSGQGDDFASIFQGDASPGLQFYATSCYLLAVLFVEPFYVAAGFGMYLNRRAELEAWDIEQEFRRAFAP